MKAELRNLARTLVETEIDRLKATTTEYETFLHELEREPIEGKPNVIEARRVGKEPHWTQTPAGRAKLARLSRKGWRTRRKAGNA